MEDIYPLSLFNGGVSFYKGGKLEILTRLQCANIFDDIYVYSKEELHR